MSYPHILLPGVLVAAGFVLTVELCSFLTIGAAQGKAFKLSQLTIDPQTREPWVIAALLLAVRLAGLSPLGFFVSFGGYLWFVALAWVAAAVVRAQSYPA